MKVMSWDSELEHWAQAYASSCPSGHRQAGTRLNGESFGENLYWKWSSAPWDPETFDYAAGVKKWYNEVTKYTGSVSPFEFISGTGHYT